MVSPFLEQLAVLPDSGTAARRRTGAAAAVAAGPGDGRLSLQHRRLCILSQPLEVIPLQANQLSSMMSSSTPVWMQVHHKICGLCVMHKASCRWVRCRVGIALLKGQWEEAVRLIMQPSSHERADSEAAKKLYLDQGDILGALKAIPRHCVAESAILEVCRGQQACMYVSWSSGAHDA